MNARLAIAAGSAAAFAGVAGVPALAGGAALGVPPALLAVALAAAGAIAGLLGVRFARRLEAVRGPRVTLRLLAIPVLVGLASAAAALLTSAPAVGLGLAWTVLALLGVLVLRSGAATHHARRLGTEARTTADLPDVDGRSPVRRVRATYGLFGLAVLTFAAGAVDPTAVVASLSSPWIALQVLLGAGFLLTAGTARRSLTAMETGLLVETPLSARLYAWDEFAGYYCGDRLVLLRRESWRSDVVFDRDAVSADAFAVLDESLPEREHRAVPAGDAERRSDRAAGER